MITLASPPITIVNTSREYKVEVIPTDLMEFKPFVEQVGFVFNSSFIASRVEEAIAVKFAIIKELRKRGHTFAYIGKLFNRTHATILRACELDPKHIPLHTLAINQLNKFLNSPAERQNLENILRVELK